MSKNKSKNKLNSKQDEQKVKIIQDLVKKMGFNKGIFSTNIVNPTKFIINDNLLKEIELLFNIKFDKKQKTNHDHIEILDSLCDSIFGANIKWETEIINGIEIHKNYKIVPQDVILEYLIINGGNDLKNNNIDFYDTIKNIEFKFSNIHGFEGKYKDFVEKK